MLIWVEYLLAIALALGVLAIAVSQRKTGANNIEFRGPIYSTVLDKFESIVTRLTILVEGDKFLPAVVIDHFLNSARRLARPKRLTHDNLKKSRRFGPSTLLRPRYRFRIDRRHFEFEWFAMSRNNARLTPNLN